MNDCAIDSTWECCSLAVTIPTWFGENPRLLWVWPVQQPTSARQNTLSYCPNPIQKHSESACLPCRRLGSRSLTEEIRCRKSAWWKSSLDIKRYRVLRRRPSARWVEQRKWSALGTEIVIQHRRGQVDCGASERAEAKAVSSTSGMHMIWRCVMDSRWLQSSRS